MALITVVTGGTTKYLPNGVPYNEGGTPGMMDTDELTLKTSVIDNDVEHTEITEYWEGTELRHRSVDMTLKQALAIEGIQGEFD